MNTHEYFSRPRLFVAISSLMFLIMLLAACGGPSTTGGSVTPTPGKTATPTPTSSAVSTTVPMPPTQTSCPLTGTARAAVMAPLALGKQDTVVYVEIQGHPLNPTSVTLKRYTVSTRTAREIVTLPQTNIYEAQISADGIWVLLHTNVSGQPAMQLIRMDGQRLQTLYCSSGPPGGSGFGWMQWSPDNKYVAFVELGPPGSGPSTSTGTFNLLNVATGTIQTKPPVSIDALAFPLAWLDTTHLYVMSMKKGLSLLDITTGTIKQIPNLTGTCIDATHTLDGTQLFTSLAAQCASTDERPSSSTSRGPSIIQVQPATGGPAKTIYSTPTDAITALRVASSTTLLLITRNINTDTSHNGLWKMNTDGTGLTRLSSDAAILKDAANEDMFFTGPFGWTMDQPWANASRDGAYYSIQVYNYGNGPSRLLIGSMKGGVPVTCASGPQEAPVGWTMM